jgi:hypothetical protein
VESQVAILDAYGQVGVEVLKNAVAPLSATGDTINSIHYEVKSSLTRDRLTLFAREFFQTLETGRGPRESAVSSGFEDKLREYVQARFGFMDEKKQEQFTKFLRWKINKEGDKTYKEGGREVYSQDLQKFVDELHEAVVTNFRSEFRTTIKSFFHS